MIQTDNLNVIDIIIGIDNEETFFIREISNEIITDEDEIRFLSSEIEGKSYREMGGMAVLDLEISDRWGDDYTYMIFGVKEPLLKLYDSLKEESV